jgi:hypothetical protein
VVQQLECLGWSSGDLSQHCGGVADELGSEGRAFSREDVLHRRERQLSAAHVAAGGGDDCQVGTAARLQRQVAVLHRGLDAAGEFGLSLLPFAEQEADLS